jgi:hypothetical protein
MYFIGISDRQEKAGFHAVFNQSAHLGHFLRRGESACFRGLVDTQEFHSGMYCLVIDRLSKA